MTPHAHDVIHGFIALGGMLTIIGALVALDQFIRRWHLEPLHPDDEARYAALPADQRQGDLYCFPVGADCAQIIGLEWSKP